MKKKCLLLFLLPIVLLYGCRQENQSVKENSLMIYPLQSCYSLSSVATVAVNGKDVPVAAFTKEYDRAQFSFSGKADIAVTVKQAITSFTVSPLAKNITATADDKTLSFTLTESAYLIIKINDLKEIVLIADDAETDIPSGDGVYNLVSRYAADPTGETLVTDKLQQAIDDAFHAGGGTVYVPAGLYYFDKGICLKSNVDLYLEGGAVLRSVATPDNYETRCHKNSLDMDVTWLFYTEEGAEHIKLYGRGILDGNGTAMRQDHHYLATIVMPLGCSDFTVDGLTLLDGNFWSMIPTRSDHVTVQNVKHLNDNNVLYENDAIDICECQHVVVKHDLAISEDDTYSTKTWATYPTTDIVLEWYGEPEENDDILFDDCFGWSHCGTFKVGDGNFQPQRNITFRNSYSYRSMSALKITHGHGNGVAENITFENIDIEGFGGRDPSFQKWMDFYQSTDGPIRNVTLRNVNVRTTGKSRSTLKGKSNTYCYDGVTLENIFINGSSAPATTLAEMNVTDTNPYVKNLTILPISEEKVPEDPGNLAFRAAVTVSSFADDCPAEGATDGYENTRWASARSDPQWIYVDLGESKTFDTVILLWEAAYGKRFTVDVSDDASVWTTVYTEENGSGGEQTISVGEQTARYVRMNGISRGTSYGYSLYEFKVRKS